MEARRRKLARLCREAGDQLGFEVNPTGHLRRGLGVRCDGVHQVDQAAAPRHAGGTRRRTEADVRRLLAEKKIRVTPPDPETARVALDLARRHNGSAEKIMADDPALAFTALYDAMRKAIVAPMRSRGYHVTRGAGAHAKTGEYALAALDQLGIGDDLDEFDAVRDFAFRASTTQPESTVADVREALKDVRARSSRRLPVISDGLHAARLQGWKSTSRREPHARPITTLALRVTSGCG
jgi:hypothetical protein